MISSGRGYLRSMNGRTPTGRGGVPFHALLAPLPVGAFLSSLIFDILTWTRADGLPYLVDGAFWLIGTGLISGLLAAIAGVVDLGSIARHAPAFRTAVIHLVFNLTAAILFGIGYAWRAGAHVELDKTRPGQLALSAVAAVVLIAALFSGVKLTYRHGVRVVGRAN